MKLSVVKRISKESIDQSSKSLPSWLDNLLAPLNDYLEKMYLAVSGRLTFADNFYSTTVTVELTHNTQKTIGTQTNAQVLGCLLVNSGGAMVTGFTWENAKTSQVNVTVQLSGATTATCTLILLLK